jgi:hypothetical protein
MIKKLTKVELWPEILYLYATKGFPSTILGNHYKIVPNTIRSYARNKNVRKDRKAAREWKKTIPSVLESLQDYLKGKTMPTLKLPVDTIDKNGINWLEIFRNKELKGLSDTDNAYRANITVSQLINGLLNWKRVVRVMNNLKAADPFPYDRLPAEAPPYKAEAEVEVLAKKDDTQIVGKAHLLVYKENPVATMSNVSEKFLALKTLLQEIDEKKQAILTITNSLREDIEKELPSPKSSMVVGKVSLPTQKEPPVAVMQRSTGVQAEIENLLTENEALEEMKRDFLASVDKMCNHLQDELKEKN